MGGVDALTRVWSGRLISLLLTGSQRQGILSGAFSCCMQPVVILTMTGRESSVSLFHLAPGKETDMLNSWLASEDLKALIWGSSGSIAPSLGPA